MPRFSISRRAVALAVLLLAPPALAQDSVATTQAVFEHHNAAFGAGDVQEMLFDYAENAVFITPMGVFTGHSEIGPFFEAVIAEFAKPGSQFTVDQVNFHDNVAYFSWHAETADNIYELGSDTLIIEDGKIATQTLALKIVPKS